MERLASTVLALGRPIAPPTPCEGPCSYALDIQGPRFHCEEAVGQNASLFAPCQGDQLDLVFAAEMWEVGGRRQPSNNSFSFSAYHGRDYSGDCVNSTLKTFVCHTTLAEYHVEIANAENGTATYTTEIRNDTEFWTTPESIRFSYFPYYLFSDKTGIREKPINQTQLTTEFAHTQAYTMAYTVVKAIVGDVRRCKKAPSYLVLH